MKGLNVLVKKSYCLFTTKGGESRDEMGLIETLVAKG